MRFRGKDILTLTLAMCLAACAGGPTAAGHVASSTSGGAEVTRFPAPVTAVLPVAVQRRLQAVLDEAVVLHRASADAGARGLTAALLTDHGSWAGSAGTDGRGATLRPEAMMPIDSITKSFVAAEVLLLAHAKTIDLNAPLSRYLPEQGITGRATVRQVLSMRSGVSDPPQGTFEAMARLASTTPLASWTLARTLAYLKPTATAPGTVPVYANSNYLLLGLLIEKVTGKPMAELLRADLFNPAHLARIAAQDLERPTPPVGNPPASQVPKLDGYLPSRAWAYPPHDTFAGIAADAPTLAWWGYQLYGSRLLPPAWVRTLTTQPSTDYVFPSTGYALGTMVFYQLSTDPAYGHQGGGPASSSILVVVPARRLSLAILAPEEGRNTDQIATELLRALG